MGQLVQAALDHAADGAALIFPLYDAAGMVDGHHPSRVGPGYAGLRLRIGGGGLALGDSLLAGGGRRR